MNNIKVAEILEQTALLLEYQEGYSYMAVCCLDMNKQDEFLYYLKLAVERNPKEARTIMNGYFPEGMQPEEYYDYMLNKMSNQ